MGRDMDLHSYPNFAVFFPTLNLGSYIISMPRYILLQTSPDAVDVTDRSKSGFEEDIIPQKEVSSCNTGHLFAGK